MFFTILWVGDLGSSAGLGLGSLMWLMSLDSPTEAEETGMPAVRAWSWALFYVASHPAGGWLGLRHSMMIGWFQGGKGRSFKAFEDSNLRNHSYFCHILSIKVVTSPEPAAGRC